jgi:hypothetical protein
MDIKVNSLFSDTSFRKDIVKVIEISPDGEHIAYTYTQVGGVPVYGNPMRLTHTKDIFLYIFKPIPVSMNSILEKEMGTEEWKILLKNNINDESIVDLDSRVSVRCALHAMREFRNLI